MGLKMKTLGRRGLTTVEDEAIMFMAGTFWRRLYVLSNNLGLIFVFWLETWHRLKLGCKRYLKISNNNTVLIVMLWPPEEFEGIRFLYQAERAVTDLNLRSTNPHQQFCKLTFNLILAKKCQDIFSDKFLLDI